MQIKIELRGNATLLEPRDPQETFITKSAGKTNIRTICKSVSQFQLFESNHYVKSMDTKISSASLHLNCKWGWMLLVCFAQPSPESFWQRWRWAVPSGRVAVGYTITLHYSSFPRAYVHSQLRLPSSASQLWVHLKSLLCLKKTKTCVSLTHHGGSTDGAF